MLSLSKLKIYMWRVKEMENPVLIINSTLKYDLVNNKLIIKTLILLQIIKTCLD